jgi:hypothetical protein
MLFLKYEPSMYSKDSVSSLSEYYYHMNLSVWALVLCLKYVYSILHCLNPVISNDKIHTFSDR